MRLVACIGFNPRIASVLAIQNARYDGDRLANRGADCDWSPHVSRGDSLVSSTLGCLWGVGCRVGHEDDVDRKVV